MSNNDANGNYENGNARHVDAVALIGDNWRSALCVTSLYDAYVALQHEADALRDENRALRHANDLLRATEPTRGRGGPEESDDGSDATTATLRQELRLVKAERDQHALLWDKQRTELERQVDDFRARWEDARDKYQQRVLRDPNEAQRVALSTQSLQTALERAAVEKAELVAQCRELTRRLGDAERRQREANDAWTARFEELQRTREREAAQRVRVVLDRWLLQRTGNAWRRWQVAVMTARWEQDAKQRQRTRVFHATNV
ncbi:hypothetical protein PINS_up010812 [Pythium insidiosum]|nr:hypothetical protein PINS_up010812 [Pythium insidiosum]